MAHALCFKDTENKDILIIIHNYNYQIKTALIPISTAASHVLSIKLYMTHNEPWQNSKSN